MISLTNLGYACSRYPSLTCGGFKVSHLMLTFDIPRRAKINRDIMVYSGFRDARWDILDPPPQDLLRTTLRTTGYYLGLSWVIPDNLVISYLSTRLFLSCHCSRIAPYDRMNVTRTFLVYADNTVYQICTPTDKSHWHGPENGTISVAEAQG